MSAPPPAYTVDPELPKSEALPPYEFPQKFSIGTHTIEGPLVTVSQVKGHLALLHAFAELRLRVEGMDPDKSMIPQMPKDKERRWGWYVGLAVERYDSLRCFLPSFLPINSI